MTAPLLEVDAVDVFYGPIQALRCLSLHVGHGERVALVGANGAGKTSTLRTVSGLIRPREGEVRLDGERIDRLTPDRIVERGIAHVPEGRELFASMSVEDNLRAGFWPRRRSGESFAEARDRVMDHFPILRERRRQAAGTLSGGEQQMLVVSRALMSDPRVLVIDELSLGLAPKIVTQLFENLAEVNRAGTALVIVEQFVHMALANTDRAYVLAKGGVVMEGRSSDLLDDPQLIATYLGDQAGAGNTPSPNGTRKKASGRSRPQRRAAGRRTAR